MWYLVPTGRPRRRSSSCPGRPSPAPATSSPATASSSCSPPTSSTSFALQGCPHYQTTNTKYISFQFAYLWTEALVPGDQTLLAAQRLRNSIQAMPSAALATATVDEWVFFIGWLCWMSPFVALCRYTTWEVYWSSPSRRSVFQSVRFN